MSKWLKIGIDFLSSVAPPAQYVTPSIRGRSNKKGEISENGWIARQGISKNQFEIAKEAPEDVSANNSSAERELLAATEF